MHQKGVQLTAKELYFLGKFMHAVYIDYAYIAAMPDIQKRYALNEQASLESLEEKGLIEEDFSGEIEIPDDVRQLFEPVFFGKKESKLDNGEVYRIHILENRFTGGMIEGENLSFFRMSEDDLGDLLKGTVQIHCSDVEKGCCERTFTGEQLIDAQYREKAISILKGEI